MSVVHACCVDGRIALWAEHAASIDDLTHRSTGGGSEPFHPFGLTGVDLMALVDMVGIPGADTMGEIRPVAVMVPSNGRGPMPSPSLAHRLGAHEAHEGTERSVQRWTVWALVIGPDRVIPALDAIESGLAAHAEEMLEEETGHDKPRKWHAVAGESVRFFATCARFARCVLAAQRFVPAVVGVAGGRCEGAWEPWLEEHEWAERMELLEAGMPGSARAGIDACNHDPRAIVHTMLRTTVEASCRAALERENLTEAIEERDPMGDEHVAWLTGLLGRSAAIVEPRIGAAALGRTVRQWIGTLEERGHSTDWKLMLRLAEPVIGDPTPGSTDPAHRWRLSFHLQCTTDDRLIIDAQDIWTLRATVASVGGRRVEMPQELLLADLGRANRIYPRLESALNDSAPTHLELSTSHAYEFLREVRPLLIEQGFTVEAPEWWDSPAARLGVRLQLNAPSIDPAAASPRIATVGEARLGLDALVGYEWKLAVGDTILSLEEFQRLAADRAPLVRIDGKWVEVRREDLDRAMQLLRDQPGGEVRVGDALRMAWATDTELSSLPVFGIDAQGWIADLLGSGAGDAKFEMLNLPEGFHGLLRPYQLKGLSWLAFLDRLGFGPCLADDMGLGKTVQLVALLAAERTNGARPDPTLIVVPMSIVENWVREVHRFAPSLKVVVHHGPGRRIGDAFFKAVTDADVVITTYALAHRDRELLECVRWGRIVVDEAQNIKNPAAKQSQAVRALDAGRRVALTGTPLENRLSELWSILDFCNPGLLGSAGDFRRQFGVPIERHRDRRSAARLRKLVQPFILRRLKTDPAVISDLPEKLETKEFCRLTTEQVELYESCVKLMLGEVDRADGIRRRGVVLTALVRLKQICDHPALVAGTNFAADDGESGDDDGPIDAEAHKSGKCIRLLELLEEVIASGQQALVFTQFRRMGVILASMISRAFDRDALLLHGGTPQTQRQALIDRFQAADGTAPVFVLSLKAGGVGLNLTAATHVFHFDRWWNPAVENQATDRAFRIGQKRTVNVHKFIVAGTLEEKIDQMIESKIALAEDVIGSGEAWLTELSTSALRDILSLRPEARADEDEA